MLRGRCYCGASTLAIDATPQIVTYCHCMDCSRLAGAPVAAEFDYLPGQIHVPIGVLDAADLAPSLHAYVAAQLPWLHISDDLPREGSSAREDPRSLGGGA